MLPQVTKHQSFRPKRIRRSQINFAAYNPRRISEDAEAGLSKSLSRFGLCEALVWNEQTGNLVGGHQRLSQIDQRERGEDYWLDVAAVNLDPRKEVQLNVLLNQHDIQGEFDMNALERLASEFDFDMGDFGFLADTLEDAMGLGEEDEGGEDEAPPAAAPKEKEGKEGQLVVSFGGSKALQDFCKAVGLKAGTKKVKADMLLGIMRKAFEEGIL